MKKSTLFFILTLSFLFISCSKDDDQPFKGSYKGAVELPDEWQDE